MSFHLGAIHIHPLSLSLSIHDLSYTSPALSVSSPHVTVALRVPTPTKPTFLTLTVHDYDYADPAHRVSSATVHATLSLFPVAPDTVVSATLHDFRVRTFSSEHTPPWLQGLRNNLVSTVLNGHWIRLDDISTKLILSTAALTGTHLVADDGDGDDHREDQHPQRWPYKEKHYSYMDEPSYDPSTESQPTSASAPPPAEDEEAVLTLAASEWHITTFHHRLYTFGTIDAQLRRAWDPSADRGSFAMVAKNSSWVLTPLPDAPGKSKSKFLALLAPLLPPLTALLSLPTALLTALHDPAAALTLRIPRLDVTFDRFRLEDAELVRQGAEFLRREWLGMREKERARGREWAVGEFLWDACVQGVLGVRGEGGVRAGEYYRRV